MTAFTETWNATYETLPADSEDAKDGANRIRKFKTAVQERLEVDHSHAGDAHDGKHNKVTLQRVSDPTLDANDVALYAKVVGTKTELFYKDQDGNVIQLTSGGGASLFLPGEVKAVAFASTPTGWLLCDGSAVSRATYARLFTAISTTWGVGDGATTFNLPDLRGRALIGDGAGAGLTARTVGQQTIGAETHTLTAAQSGRPDHGHAGSTVNIASDGSHSHDVLAAGAGTGPDTVKVRNINTDDVGATVAGAAQAAGAHTHGGSTVTIAASGAADAASSHPNMQPSAVVRWIIKT